MKKYLSLPLGPFLIGLFWLGLALLVFRGIASMSPAEAGSMGPATFPKILAVSLSLLVVIHWIQSRKGKTTPFFEMGKRRDALQAVSFVVLAFGSAFFWESLGALPVLLLLSFVELTWIEGFGWKKVLTVGITLSVGIWLVFTVLLGVTLPLGLLIRLY